MPSTILTNWTVYYEDDAGVGAGMKQIKWTGTTGTTTVNALYTALMNLFDNSSQNNAIDSIPIKAVTPTLYQIGSFDAGDKRPWFIDPESIKHLKSGGLNSTKWARTGGGTGDAGILKITRSGTNIVPGDIGAPINNGTATGWLLHVDSTDSTHLWIRPTSNSATHNWSTGSGTITCNGHNDTQTAAATTGEMIWSNLFTLGNIEANTTIHVAQNNTVISNAELSGSGFWWSAGHIDVLILTTDQSTLIDRGLLTFYARQYSKRYSYYVADASLGGRTPIPLATSDDPNNETGHRQMVLSTSNDAFAVGDVIQDDSDATIQGVVTSYDSGTNTLQYYLIGSLTDFSAGTGTFASVSPGTGTGTAVNSTSVGPAALAMTITFGLDQTFDIDNDTTNEDYSIVIDLANSISLSDMNERLKYITRRGETTTLDGIEGQQYIGIDYRVDYTTITGTIAEGSTITQTLADSTIATSEVVAHNTTDDYLMLRDTRGTLETGGGATYLGIDGSNNVTMSSGATAITIAPSLEHPFGLFAGGKFFGARGVVLDNVPAADANNYQVVDNDGISKSPPLSVALVVTGVVQNTQCYVVDSVPTTYLNTPATSLVSGDEYQASTTLAYTGDIVVTVRAREMGYLPFQTTGTITNSGLSVTAVWQVDPNWKFVLSGINISFTNPDTITRASGDFSADGWLSVMGQVTVSGAGVNNGTYTITAVGTTTITVTGGITTAGAASGITLSYTRRAPTW